MTRRGLNGYVAGVPGFYVVNPRTNIAVSAWATRESAEKDAATRDARYPDDQLKLAVVRIACDENWSRLASDEGERER